MKMATKATLQRLRTIDTRAGELLQKIVEIANNAQDYYDRGFKDVGADVRYTPVGISGILHSDYDKKTLLGLSTRHEKFVSTTFTHGNNEYQITNINELVKRMVAENPPTCKARKLFVR